jgi:hypothetical protein
MTDEEAPDEETTDDSEQPTDGRETQSARSGR